MTGPGISKWTLLSLVLVAAVAADQATKFLAVDRLTYAFQRVEATTLPQKLGAFYSYRDLERFSRPPYTVWKPMWQMAYAENPGAAWGLGREMSEGTRNGVFMLISVAAGVFILAYYRRLARPQRYLQVALALVLSGAIGNFLDRVARHYVIDFVKWHWWNRPSLYWPIFNLADSLIVVGVALLLVHPGPKQQKSGAPEPRVGGNGRAAPGR